MSVFPLGSRIAFGMEPENGAGRLAGALESALPADEDILAFRTACASRGAAEVTGNVVCDMCRRFAGRVATRGTKRLARPHPKNGHPIA